MKFLPQDVGIIHFIGIGGIGMSGIADVLHHLGYRVQGSDQSASTNVRRLQEQGIRVAIGHRAANLGEAAVVVFSSAVSADNPEMIEARARRLPVVRRADMLGELMRLKSAIAIAGTHGKTTTTSLVAALLDAAGLDPTVVNGGIINAYGTNARVGAGDWMVVESDESDGSFLRLPATIGVVTNIDPEHMEHYGTFEAVRDAYYSFVERLPFYGFAALCLDHPEVQALIARITDRRVVTYGFSPQADVRATSLSIEPGGSTFDVTVTRRGGRPLQLDGMFLAMPGRHNVQNALAVIAIAEELGIDHAATRKALSSFGGVKRRFTITGKANGVTVVDDYGHHPVEIRAVLATARQATKGRVVAIVQPHRYSRLASLFDEFCGCLHDADTVLIAPVYAAGEAPIEGADRDRLVAGIQARGHRDCRPIKGPEGLADLVRAITEPGDLVVCLGAGTITAWANALPAEMAALAEAA
ncbi:UDP-N-acetylmuramate--L-alanine ligase [Geminicoccus flavidas]|uniref:UDP-N-acetylmuramate--L-alanine ligase n=1 Tax=Geminicoccus flavidas TaxID=2506407 RepID=UPI00190FAA03|nr:UDP-N-acetylmuramate--L-alanine ligase [Geminicoccus flavidas]